MKKENIPTLFYIVSVILIVGFIARLGVDYYQIIIGNNSIPFYVYIIERTIEFLVPSVIFIFVAKYFKKEYIDNITK